VRLIETILKTVAQATDGVKHYGRGAKAYSNLQSEHYPRIWVHLVNPRDVIHQNNAVTTTYEVIGEVSGLCSYTADIANNEQATLEYLNYLETLQLIYYRFITNLNKHPNNKIAIGQVNRRELLHEYDDNLTGYVFTFTLTINEPIAYQC